MGSTPRIVTIKRSGADGPHFPLSLSSCLFGRYEDESRQDGSGPAGLPGQRQEQESTRQVSGSGCPGSGGGVQEPSAHSSLTEGGVPGRSLARRKSVQAAGSAPELPRAHGGPSAGAPAGDEAGMAPGSCSTGPGAVSPARRPAGGSSGASPFRRLYESMKEELDVKSDRANVLQDRRKSGALRLCREAPEGACGLQAEVQAPVSLKFRRKSGRSSQVKADPVWGEGGSSLASEQRAGDGSGQHPGEAASPARARAGTPVPPPSGQSPSRKRRREDLGGPAGGASVSPGPDQGPGADGRAWAPWKFLTGGPTPAKVARAESPGATPDKPPKSRRSSPAREALPRTDPGTQNPAVLAPLPVQLERAQKDAPHQAEKPGLPGLSHGADPTGKTEGAALKRRRVSFGGRLRPELFDENLPPNTPLKRGETPVRRRSLAPHTPAALKKIIKEQPPSPAGGAASEAQREPGSPGASGPRRRSIKAATTPGRSPHASDAPKRGARRSSGLSAKRASLERGRQGALHLLCARRRSGASEANLLVAKSWADVVKLGAKQTQARAAKPAPPRQLHRRPRQAPAPQKPAAGSVRLAQFSTGHANSPCTITIGRAHLGQAGVPARPHRVLSHLVFRGKADFSEDLSGTAEPGAPQARDGSEAAAAPPAPLPRVRRGPGEPRPERQSAFPSAGTAGAKMPSDHAE
ncbi:PREDICTED: antigen KI-67 [Condylura cristata]|uniref:antigen KI-67 n=1 Tax=Condylura cristata TaxID=143302 RepID=UPI0006437089|nr:PREDICTED: antigen KI-67 [Condylura cristata]